MSAILLPIFSLLIASILADRRYGNYDFQLAFYTGLKEVLVTKEMDTAYGTNFSDITPIKTSLYDYIDTCDISRFNYTPEGLMIDEGTMKSIIKNKEVVLGYVKGMDVLTKFEVDMYVLALKHMIRAYKVLDAIDSGNDGDKAEFDYKLYDGPYRANIDDNLTYGDEGDIKIRVEPIAVQNHANLDDIQIRNYDIIAGLFRFDDETYQNQLKRVMGSFGRNGNIDEQGYVMFGCNTMILDFYQMCMNSGGSENDYYYISPFMYKPINYLKPASSYGEAMGNMFKNYSETGTSHRSCVYLPHELVIFTLKHLKEICETYNTSNKEMCDTIDDSIFNIEYKKSYRSAPVFNVSIPGSEHQSQDFTIFSEIIDTLVANSGKPDTEDSLAVYTSINSGIPKTSSIKIPYPLEFTLTNFVVGMVINGNEDNENLQVSVYRNSQGENSDGELSIEKENRRFMTVALKRLSMFYGRNISGCDCEGENLKYTLDPIAQKVVLEKNNKIYRDLDSVGCKRHGIPPFRNRKIGIYTSISNSQTCQLAYSGIVWTTKDSNLDITGFMPGVPYHSERLAMRRFSYRDDAKKCSNGEYLTDSDYIDETLYVIVGTEADLFKPVEKVEKVETNEVSTRFNEESIDGNMDYFYFYGYEPQIEMVTDILKEVDSNGKLSYCDYHFPTNSAQPSGDTKYFYSKVNFVNVYSMGGKGYELNRGVVDDFARTLSIVMMALAVITTAFCIILFTWRIIRCACGKIVHPKLRRAAEKFEERRDK